MKEKKKLSGVAIVQIVCLSLMALCGGYRIIDRIVTEKEHGAQLEQATANAVQYVRKKYGFEAEVLGADKTYSWSYGDEIGKMTIKMKHGDREFYVYTSRLAESTEGWDDYQWEEISAAAVNYVNESLPGGKLVELRLGSGDTSFVYLMDTYFDGENIEEIFKECNGSIEMIYADTDFSETDIPKRLYDYNIIPEFTSFDTKEHMEEFLQKSESRGYHYYNYNDYQKYAPYITDHITFDGGETIRLNVTIQKNDEFEYCYFPTQWRSFAKSCDTVRAECQDDGHLLSIYERHGEGYALSKPLSKEYSFDSIFGDVRIYYPLEKLEGYDLKNIGLAWFSGGGMSNNRNISRAEICGEYAVFNLPFGEDRFMLVDNTGQEEYVPGWAKQ